MLLGLGQGIDSTGVVDSIVIVLVRFAGPNLSEKAVDSMEGLPGGYNCQIVVVDILPGHRLAADQGKNSCCPC